MMRQLIYLASTYPPPEWENSLINIDISVSLFDYLFLILILVGLINSLEFQIIVSTDLFAESLFLTYRASGALDMD